MNIFMLQYINLNTVRLQNIKQDTCRESIDRNINKTETMISLVVGAPSND